MIKNIKKCILGCVFLVMCIYFSGVNVLADDLALEQQEMIQRMTYEIYDKDGNLVENGIMPISEEEAQLRLDYGSRTLRNGESMILNNNGVDFIVPPGAFITMGFGLNRNANILSGIYNSLDHSSLSSWSGLTGGTALNARTTTSTSIYGKIVNRSSDVVTVNWAYFRF